MKFKLFNFGKVAHLPDGRTLVGRTKAETMDRVRKAARGEDVPVAGNWTGAWDKVPGTEGKL